jgi:hypothetical protein
MANQPCSMLNGSVYNFTCSLPLNADGTVQLPAVIYEPTVLLKNIGYALVSPAIPTIQTSFTIVSATPSVGSPAGGLLMTIQGSGFPLSTNSSMTVHFCNSLATIVNCSNQQI